MFELSAKEMLDELRRRIERSEGAVSDLKALSLELQNINRRLLESEALRSNFLSNIRNEVNDPLSSIVGFSGRIREAEHGECEKCKAMACMIHTEAFALGRQMKNIFAAADLEAGGVEPASARVDVAKLLAGVVGSFGQLSAGKRLQVVLGVQEDASAFQTDPELLGLIASNLLANAIEFSRVGGSVGVEAFMDADGRLVLRVRDSCGGIAEDGMQKIFERFRQAEEGHAKPHRGHGLGLSVTKAVAELMGGSLGLENITGGCCFSVVLPESPGDIDGAFSGEDNELIFEGGQEF